MPRFLAGGDVSRLVLDVTNLTDRPQTLNIALAASGLLELLSQQPQPVNLAPGVRTTLFVPVRALEGLGEGEIQATISGLNLPGETLGAQHKQWQIGVRPAWPAQTVNSGIALAPGESWHVPEQHLANVSPATLQGQLLLSGKTAAQSGALHSRAESISVRVPGTNHQRVIPGAVYQCRSIAVARYYRR